MRLDTALRSWRPVREEDPIALAEDIAKPFESLSLAAYWDPAAFMAGRPAGYPTQGWGHLLIRKTKAEIMRELDLSSTEADDWLRETYPPWSTEYADAVLLADLRKADASVGRLVKVPLTARQRAALIDFAFNVGAGNLQASTLLRMLNRGDYPGAADQLPRWNKSRGVVLAGLTRRRLAERRVFLTNQVDAVQLFS